MCTLSSIPHPLTETCEFFCDSTDGRHLCGWHFEALNPNPAAHGRW